MPHCTGKATVWFGQVAIPVKVYSATQAPPTIQLHQLHKADNARLKQQYVCAADGAQVAREDMVKGYEVAKDQFVTFTPEELKAAEEASSQAIEIDVCVPLDRIDPVYWGRPYYLGPDQGSEEPYALLADVLRLSNRAALASWAVRGQDLFVCLRHSEGRIVLQELLRAEEVRPLGEIEAPLPPVAEESLQLALKLVETRERDDFRPGDYPDKVYAKKLKLIAEKVAAKAIVASPVNGRTQVVDIVEGLKASVAAGPKKAPSPEPEPIAKKKKRAAR
jgi:DNA end-binding protein Ku